MNLFLALFITKASVDINSLISLSGTVLLSLLLLYYYFTSINIFIADLKVLGEQPASNIFAVIDTPKVISQRKFHRYLRTHVYQFKQEVQRYAHSTDPYIASWRAQRKEEILQSSDLWEMMSWRRLQRVIHDIDKDPVGLLHIICILGISLFALSYGTFEEVKG